MNLEFSNFMAFDSKMMLIELVDNLIFSKNDQKYQHMYYQKSEEISRTMRVQMVSFVSLYSTIKFTPMDHLGDQPGFLNQMQRTTS